MIASLSLLMYAIMGPAWIVTSALSAAVMLDGVETVVMKVDHAFFGQKGVILKLPF